MPTKLVNFRNLPSLFLKEDESLNKHIGRNIVLFF